MVKTSGKLSKLLAMLLVVAMVLSTMTFNFTVFAANANQAFTLTAKIEDTDDNYDKGDTITVGIYAKVPDGSANIGSFQFQISARNDNYDLKEITSELTGEKKANVNNGKFAFSRNTADSIVIGTTDVKIATAKYVATNATTVREEIAISSAEVTPVGYDGNSGEITKVAATANLFNIKVTFADSEGITPFDDAVAYAKYNVAGLYTTQAYSEPFTAPTATAAEGYRLYAESAYWSIGGEFKTAADIAAMKFTEDKTATATAVKQYKITLDDGEGTWVGEAPAIIVADTGKKFSEIGMPGAEKLTAPAGKVFEGWKIDGTTYAMDALDTVTVTKDLTVTAMFTDGEFGWSEVSTNATVTVTAGVTDNKAKHGRDITFTATADTGYAITEVRYTVGGADKGAIIPVDGVYTISGSAITGDVKVEVTTLKYHTVTFTASAGTTFAEGAKTKAYVVDGQSKLYASVEELAAQDATTFTLPAYTVGTGYRAADDGLKWKIGEDAKTDAALASYPFMANTEIKTYVIKTWVVTFKVASNGTFAGGSTTDITKTVDNGYVIKASDVPETSPATGYVFDAWTDAAPEGQTVSDDVIYTATFKHGTYDFSFSSVTGITVTDITGVDANKATHGTDVTFKLTVNDKLATLTAVKYKVGDNEAQPITADGGVYTVPGSAITASTTVLFETTGKVAVTFSAVNGTVKTNTVYVEIGSKVSAEQFASVDAKPNAYYELDGWYQGETKLEVPVTDVTIAKATEFTVKYKLIVRNVTAEGLEVTYETGYDNPVHGSDLKFTIAKSGSVIMDVYYAIGEGSATEITPTAEGVYTIEGANITDDITITVNAVEGTISFIARGDYKALVNENRNKKIIVFSTAKVADNKYTIGSADMFWSSKYNAYVAWVADTLSEDLKVISHTIAKAAGTTVEIGYTGDVNGDGYVTASDAGIINDCLQNVRITDTSDRMLFELDVEGTDVGNKVVTTADIVYVINKAVE